MVQKMFTIFKEGFAIVRRTNGELAKIDKQGKILVVISNNKLSL